MHAWVKVLSFMAAMEVVPTVAIFFFNPLLAEMSMFTEATTLRA
jgi:hypothetical protein